MMISQLRLFFAGDDSYPFKVKAKLMQCKINHALMKTV